MRRCILNIRRLWVLVSVWQASALSSQQSLLSFWREHTPQPSHEIRGHTQGPLQAQTFNGFAGLANDFLTRHMPPKDRNTISPEFIALTVNLSLAARQATAWAASVPEEIWLNNVLPYAW